MQCRARHFLQATSMVEHIVAHTELCASQCHMQPMHTKPHHHLGFRVEWSPQKASKQASERSECTTDVGCTWYSWVKSMRFPWHKSGEDVPRLEGRLHAQVHSREHGVCWVQAPAAGGSCDLRGSMQLVAIQGSGFSTVHTHTQSARWC
jgi:hypothetical protein